MAKFKTLDTTTEKSEKKSQPEGEAEHVRCLIIGSGPAGYTAAIYAARANLKPVLYEGLQPGGQLTTTTDVENYPGYPDGIMGPQMMEEFKHQAGRFGTDIRFGYATSVDFSSSPHKVIIDEKKVIEADSVIIATGAEAKYLGLESEKKFMGSGVSACATCDGFFYKNQDVIVIGGGDTAAEEALYLSGLCSKVYLAVRKDYMRASKIMQERVMNTDNIEVLYGHQTKEIVGEQGVEGVILDNMGNEVKLDVKGFFVAIGHKPNSDIFRDYIDMDDVGYIKTKPDTAKTNVEGVFACGDVMDSVYRQAVTAAGTGCRAAIDAERYLGEKGL
ncbi:MAG: thioredoxin-disulfide reductase [Bacteroidetes bacterium]|jgi:thioredoxin reductase (NADPH)|nr:thioredoxin-disulfide reductase [Bacteroidota bacterium]